MEEYKNSHPDSLRYVVLVDCVKSIHKIKKPLTGVQVVKMVDAILCMNMLATDSVEDMRGYSLEEARHISSHLLEKIYNLKYEELRSSILMTLADVYASE